MFYYCGPSPPTATRGVEAQAMCPTLETHALRASSHTRLRARDHYTSSTLIGGNGAAKSKFTSCWTRGTTEVCECKIDVKSTWIPTWYQMDNVSWSLGLFSKPSLGGRPNTKPVDHGTLNAHHRWFILFYHGWEPAWIKTHWNSIWLRARSHMTSHLHMRIRDHTTWFWRSHKFMVAALGLCVKWPLGHVRQPTFRSLSHF
jgi:hypothetical protein